MTIHLNLFNPLLKDKIRGNVGSTSDFIIITLWLKLDHMSYDLGSCKYNWSLILLETLVNMSVNCSLELTSLGMSPDYFFSYEMIIHLDMFDLPIEDKIRGNV